MSIKNWIKNSFGPEANLLRLQREVERKELQAKYAEAEIPLLEKKDKALATINKRKEIKQSIRKKQIERLNPDNAPKKESFIKLRDPGSNFKVKSPIDRVYKN